MSVQVPFFLAVPRFDALFVCGLVLLVPIVIVALIVLVARPAARRSGSEEELRIVQEIYTTLGNMEKRVETLETILLAQTEER